MEYIAAVLGHLKSNAFSFPFSLIFCFNSIHIGEKNKKRGSCVTNRPIQHTHLGGRGGSHGKTIHDDDGTYLLVQATSRTCYTADFIPPQSAFFNDNGTHARFASQQ